MISPIFTKRTGVLLLGHNGAGKSTLLSYMLGFYPDPSAHPYLPALSHHVTLLDRASTGYAPEAAYLDDAMTGGEYVRLLAGLRQVRRPDPAALFARVELDASPKTPIHRYSKGMKQRLLLALALVGEPETLVLDEPTSGLDPFGREAVGRLLEGLKKERRLILSTHSLELAARLGGETWILKEGEVVYKGTPSGLEELRALFFRHRPERSRG